MTRNIKSLYIGCAIALIVLIGYVSHDANKKLSKANALITEARIQTELAEETITKEKEKDNIASTFIVAQSICDEKVIILNTFLNPPIILNNTMLIGQSRDGRLFGVADTNKAMPIGWICDSIITK